MLYDYTYCVIYIVSLNNTLYDYTYGVIENMVYDYT
jgi:hypothetical protein